MHLHAAINRSDSEILGYALDTLYNIICNDEEEEQGNTPSQKMITK